MKAIKTGAAPSTLDTLEFVDIEDAPAQGPGEITVRVRASSLNFHDFAVVSGMIPAPVGRIPMSDGAGEVTAVGEGVSVYAVGDSVVSTFFPDCSTVRRRPPASQEFRATVSAALLAKRLPRLRPHLRAFRRAIRQRKRRR